MTLSSTARWIAFLRAINVGGHTVKMDHLRALFEEMGFYEVETFIASGNVIFTTDADGSPAGTPLALEQRIARNLEHSLGYAVATFLRTPSELLEAAHRQPFPEEAQTNLYVAFLPASPSEAAQQKLLSMRSQADELVFHGRELYWLLRRSFRDSPFSGAVLEKNLGMPTTVRNINTLRRLVAKITS